MAFATITVSNGIEIKQAPLGFSWTTFFFGFCPALFRQDWIMAIVIAALGLFTFGMSTVVFAFIYNKMYLKSLLNSGYTVEGYSNGVGEEMVKNYLGFVTLPTRK